VAALAARCRACSGGQRKPVLQAAFPDTATVSKVACSVGWAREFECEYFSHADARSSRAPRNSW